MFSQLRTLEESGIYKNMIIDTVDLESSIALNTANQEQLYCTLCKKFAWAKDYIYYYVYVVYAVRDSIVPILMSICEEDQQTFTYKKGYEYLKKYESSRLSLAVIIPTYNRPKAIRQILTYAAVLYRRMGIDIIIYDSSNNEDTRKITEEMYNNGYYNVIYKKYTGLYDGFSLDHKIISAYQEFSDSYEYIWICRDGLIPIVDEIVEKIRYYAHKHVQCFIIDTKSRTENVEIEKEYASQEDCVALLAEQATRLQTLGMLIVSSDFAQRLIDEVPLDEKTYSLWQMAAPFHLFVKEPYRIIFFTKNVFAFNNGASEGHSWSKAEKALEQWAYRWNKVISNMPSEYDEAKEQCRMVYTVDFHPFTFNNIMEMRGWEGLTLKLVKKYKTYLVQATNTPLWCFYVISCLPPIIARGCNGFIKRYYKYAKYIRKFLLRKT